MDSEKWAGFTEADIENLKNNPIQSDSNKATFQTQGPMKIMDSTKVVQQEQFLFNCKNESNHHKSGQFEGTWKIKDPNAKISASVESLDNCTCENSNCESYAADLSDESCESNGAALSEDKNSSERITDIQELEIFEARQKRIEAENARRRALINKAIIDKKKRTQAEAEKLSQITNELKHIDSELSSDVNILRDYIEKASHEFSEAEKRYLKAEKELIEAKFLLFEKMQRKEQLTEHLCAIIEQNENRKANKLVELMKQLEMETIVEDFESSEMQPVLSKYCMMNDEAYHCCQTLKPSTPVSPTSDNSKCDSKDSINDSGHISPDKESCKSETSPS